MALVAVDFAFGSHVEESMLKAYVAFGCYPTGRVDNTFKGTIEYVLPVHRAGDKIFGVHTLCLSDTIGGGGRDPNLPCNSR